jgi:hypothetical protein
MNLNANDLGPAPAQPLKLLPERASTEMSWSAGIKPHDAARVWALMWEAAAPQPAQRPLTDDQMRAAFEAWLNPGQHAGNVSAWVEPGRYEKDTHQLAWLAWRAATERAPASGGPVALWHLSGHGYAPVTKEQSHPPEPLTWDEAIKVGWRPFYAAPRAA